MQIKMGILYRRNIIFSLNYMINKVDIQGVAVLHLCLKKYYICVGELGIIFKFLLIKKQKFLTLNKINIFHE